MVPEEISGSKIRQGMSPALDAAQTLLPREQKGGEDITGATVRHEGAVQVAR